MYAIVEIAGQQYKVEKNQEIFVHRLEGKEGSNVDFHDVLMIDNKGKVVVGSPHIKGAAISAKILEHTKGDKVLVFKKKRRKGYQKLNGHRQYLTLLQITNIAETGAQPKAKAETKPAAKPKAEEKPAAKPKVEKKPAAKPKAATTAGKAAAKPKAAPKATAKATPKTAEVDKPAAKKPAAKKTTTKPAAKKTAKPAAKKTTKPAAKSTTKPAAKKATPKKDESKETNKE
jgi:large subunit ribosomal protein L21